MIDAELIGKDLYLDIDNTITNILDIALDLRGESIKTFVHINTTEYWNSKSDLVGEKGHIYVYTDSCYVEGEPIPGIKVGDGMSYLIDNAFVASNQEMLYNHINNAALHVQPGERYFWNNKVRCDESTISGTTLTFTKN